MKWSAKTLTKPLLACLVWGSFALAQTPPAGSTPAGVNPAGTPQAKAKPKPKFKSKLIGKKSKLEAEHTQEPAAASKNGLTVEKILVKGNRKIEADAIRNKLISKVNGPYREETVRQDIQELFNMGFFYNVEVDRSEGGPKVTLTYTVTEKPSISEIEYRGHDELEETELKDTTGIKAYEILNMAKIREATDKLEKLYEDKGFFLARISFKIEPGKDPDTVKLVFDIKENDKVKVKRISFLGNKKMASGKLKSGMITQEGGYFSFISGAGAYKQDAFDRDVQMLNYLYFNEGYVQVKVDRPQVYVTPDKKAIYITIRVEEGEQFKVGTVDFTGDLLFSRAELFESTHIQEQDLFRYQVLQDDLKALQAKYGDLGYAYANPIPRTRIREADKEVDITFEIDKGYKVYFGKFNMVGDSKTRDKVIRREMRIIEGELYNETRKRESLENIKRLGYFEEVVFNNKTPKGRNDIMDIDVVVKERNTGTIQVGAGYSNFNGFVFNGQVNQINFLGKGQSLGVSIDLSKVQSLYKASFTEPYFMDTLWSVGGDIYRSQRALTEYAETKTGADVRIGHPLAPFLNGFIRYKL
ncbi:MAG: outer membrane protein assembly factor BamA, partial [Bdellovibrionales bacterium]